MRDHKQPQNLAENSLLQGYEGYKFSFKIDTQKIINELKEENPSKTIEEIYSLTLSKIKKFQEEISGVEGIEYDPVKMTGRLMLDVSDCQAFPIRLSDQFNYFIYDVEDGYIIYQEGRLAQILKQVPAMHNENFLPFSQILPLCYQDKNLNRHIKEQNTTFEALFSSLQYPSEEEFKKIILAFESIEVREEAINEYKDFIEQMAETTSEYLPELNSPLLNKSHICIGETHNDSKARRFILDNLEYFKLQGINTIFLEGIPYDSLQTELDSFLETRRMSRLLEDFLLDLDESTHDGNEITLKELIGQIVEHDIRVVGLETALYTSSYLLFDQDMQETVGKKRMPLFNFYASEIIKREKGDDRSMSLTGLEHNSSVRYKGLQQLLGRNDTSSIAIIGTDNSKKVIFLNQDIILRLDSNTKLSTSEFPNNSPQSSSGLQHNLSRTSLDSKQ